MRHTISFNDTTLTTRRIRDQSFWITTIKTPFNTIIVQNNIYCGCPDSIWPNRETLFIHVVKIVFRESDFEGSKTVDLDGNLIPKTPQTVYDVLEAVRERIPVQTIVAFN